MDHLSVSVIDGRTGCVCDAAVSEISPGLLVMVLSEGAHRLFIDGQALDVQGGDEGGDGTVVLLNTTRASRLHHDPGEAAPVRSVTIAAPHAWLDGLRRATTETDPVLQDFLSTHRAQLTVPASRQIRHLADQIYDPPPTLSGAMRALHCKARALDILCQACAAVREHTGERSQPHLASRRRSERVRDYVLANLGANLTIERIAAEIGASGSLRPARRWSGTASPSPRRPTWRATRIPRTSRWRSSGPTASCPSTSGGDGARSCPERGAAIDIEVGHGDGTGPIGGEEQQCVVDGGLVLGARKIVDREERLDGAQESVRHREQAVDRG